MSAAEAWREGQALLSARVAEAPELLCRAFGTHVPNLAAALAGARALRTTGLGSSAGHARYLAHLLAERCRLPARFTPTGAFLAGPPAGADEEVLFVFSQGLSPNARFALQDPKAWRHVVLVSALASEPAPPSSHGSVSLPGPEPEAEELLAKLSEAGATILPLPGDLERGTLLRVAGPLCGYAVALRIAQALALPEAGLAELAAERIVARVREAHAAESALPPGALAGPLVLLASGSYAELVGNLRLKLVEGLLRPPPAVWDPLEFVHGPFQQVFPGEATLLLLSRAAAPREEELLGRLVSMLDPERHRLVRVPSERADELAIFEHEARLNRIVLDQMARERVDPVSFPGRGADAPVYDFRPGRRS